VEHAAAQNNYDLDAEYATSIYDSPHRIILAPIVPLPGRRSGGLASRAGWRLDRVGDRRDGERLAAAMP
jgi:hypothetical protein